MLLDLNRHPRRELLKEARLLLALALPMMLAQAASVGVGVVDTVMAGRAGKDDLTAVALGSSVFSMLYITLMGVMTALNPMVAQLFGSGRDAQTGETGRQGLWFGLFLGLAGTVLLLALLLPLKNYLDMPGRVEEMFGGYLFYTALGMPAAMLHRALYAYASGLNRPKPAMWVGWAALLLNIPLNYLFVYGKLGLPKMGGAGCGAATAVVFWFSAAALGVYIAKERGFRRFGLAARFSRPDWAQLRQMWQLGWPIGFSYFLEASLFALIVWLVARFGQDYVSAQQIVISISGVVYMVPQAVGAAATVRVGHALGQRRYGLARYVSGVSLLAGWLLAACTCAFLLAFRLPLAALYTDDAAVLHIGAAVLVFAAVFQLFDFTQCIASYALRGYKITRAPMLIHAAAFWGLGLLPGCLLAYPLGMGIYGFWTALVFSLAAAAAALVWHLEKHSRRISNRQRQPENGQAA